MAALAVVMNPTIGTVIAKTFQTLEAAMVVVVDVEGTETIAEEEVVINTMVLLRHDHRLVGNHLHQVVRALGEVHHHRCLLMDGNLLVNSEVKWDISNSHRHHLRQIITTSPINRMGGIRTTGEAEAAISID